MTEFETITLLIALLAIVPSVVALVRQSSQRRRIDQIEAAQLRQQQATAELHEKQLQLLLESEASKGSAMIKLSLFRDGSVYKFRVTNIGSAPAKNVEVKFYTENGAHNPIQEQDYKAKFPAPTLDSGSSIIFLAVIYFEGPSSFNGVVSWTDPNRTRVENAAYVTI